MTDKICGIIKRAFYLFAGIWAVGCFFAGTMGIIRHGFESDVTSMLIAGILTMPIAYMIHRATRWVFFG